MVNLHGSLSREAVWTRGNIIFWGETGKDKPGKNILKFSHKVWSKSQWSDEIPEYFLASRESVAKKKPTKPCHEDRRISNSEFLSETKILWTSPGITLLLLEQGSLSSVENLFSHQAGGSVRLIVKEGVCLSLEGELSSLSILKSFFSSMAPALVTAMI